jgi:hypothetical protein
MQGVDSEPPAQVLGVVNLARQLHTSIQVAPTRFQLTDIASENAPDGHEPDERAEAHRFDADRPILSDELQPALDEIEGLCEPPGKRMRVSKPKVRNTAQLEVAGFSMACST